MARLVQPSNRKCGLNQEGDVTRSGFMLGAAACLLFATGCGAGLGDSEAADVADLGQQVSFTVLDVDGDLVRTHRDAFAVPHIFAETRRGLFVAYGYAVAQDRLWQLEVN